jgi:hypothetical protein
VLLDKDAVTARLRAEGDHDRALAAETALPKHVDTDRDAGLLHQFDLSVSELADGERADADPGPDAVAGGSVA